MPIRLAISFVSILSRRNASSFDESWKVGAEGDVGAYWGLWDKDEKAKY